MDKCAAWNPSIETNFIMKRYLMPSFISHDLCKENKKRKSTALHADFPQWGKAFLKSHVNHRVRNTTLESRINVPLHLLIFWFFSRGYGLIMDLKDLHKFAHFKGLRLFFLSNFSMAKFIQGATSIPDTRVISHNYLLTLSKKKLLSHLYWGTQWTMEIS